MDRSKFDDDNNNNNNNFIIIIIINKEWTDPNLMMMIIIIIIIIIIIRPGYDIKLHPVLEFRRGIMRLPLATTTSRSPLSKV